MRAPGREAQELPFMSGILQMVNKISKLALGLILAAGSSSGFAQDNIEMRKYLSLDYNHVFRDNDRNSLDANGVSVGFGLPLTKLWGLEASAFFNDFDRDSTHLANWGEYGAKLDGMFFYSRNPAFSPYFGLGLGGVHSKEGASNQSSTDPFVDAGLGFFKYFAIGSHDFAVRADARYRWLDTHNINGVGSLGEPVVKVGLVIPLGARAIAAAPAAAAAMPAKQSAPVAEASPAKLDSDGDGVLDDQDQCPRSPATSTVDERGCPIDEKTRVFEAVRFDFNKSTLTKHSEATLDNAASVIKGMAKKSPVKVEVGGHTDSVGTDGYNQALSERRAQVVTKYLTKKGVDGKSISTNAYGETLPEKSNASAEGHAYNRRVEVKAIAQ